MNAPNLLSELSHFQALFGIVTVVCPLEIDPEDCLVGILGILRGWERIFDFLDAANILKNLPQLKWIVVGSGISKK
ncbi:MAG: hypothetical protein R3E91_06055 [Chlamydiales bacterium]